MPPASPALQPKSGRWPLPVPSVTLFFRGFYRTISNTRLSMYQYLFHVPSLKVPLHLPGRCQVIRPTFPLRSSRIFFYVVKLSALHPTPNLKSHASLFISLWGMVVQLFLQALGGSDTSGLPIPVPTYVGPWGKGHGAYAQLSGFFFKTFHTVHSCSQSFLFIPTKCI